MKTEKIKTIFQQQLTKSISFNNFHGITKENITEFIVEPYPVTVHPDDLETSEREMYIVLKPPSEYFVAYDSLYNSWSVIELVKNEKYIQVISGETLKEALDGM